MRKILSLFILFIITQSAYSQAVTYYPWTSTLSVATNPNRAVWGDLRFQMNSYFSSLSTEVSPMFNVSKGEKAKFYVGAGARFNFINYFTQDDPEKQNPLEGYFVSVGVRASPIAKIPRLQLAFELSPYSNKNFDLGLFRANLGLGYVFGKKF
ncbi:MAG: hypothetical protein ACK4NY_04970 [Spirosomataceae bacterium]